MGEEAPRSAETPAPGSAGLSHPFNSPFEEFAYALELSRAGVRTVYPRAIYMTGHKAGMARIIADPRPYAQLKHLRTPDGKPAISEDHEYISIWGFWNGPDELLALHDGEYYRAVNAEVAAQHALISNEILLELLARMRSRMTRAGFQHLNLKPRHLLISFTSDNRMAIDTFGKPEVRLCNFELLRRLSRDEPGCARPSA
jgi:hypothetical protein